MNQFKYIFILLFLASNIYGEPINKQSVIHVYEKIKEAKGDFRNDFPTLKITKETKYIASFNRRTNVLSIEEKAILACQTFGDNAETALAFLIGHELTHFYQNHNGNFAFFLNHASYNQKIKEEEEADIYGAMLAYWSGYKKVTNVMPALIETLYTEYDMIHRNTPDYPSLQERKELIYKVVAQTQTLVDLYESAKYLTALGNHNSAGEIYQYIREYIETKELYNNEAVAYLSAATSFQERGIKNWIYPLNIDWHNPLRETTDVHKLILIKRAKEKLEKALNYDRKYFSALLNMAIANTLEGNISKAQSFLLKAEQESQTADRVLKAKLVKAIILAQQEKKNSSAKLFNDVTGSKNKGLARIAGYNLQLLQNEFPNKPPLPTLKPIKESIDGINLNTRPTLKEDKKILLNSDPFNLKTLVIQQFTHSTLLLLTTPKQTFSFHKTTQPTSNGIKLGASFQAIKNRYLDQEPRIIAHNEGGYFMEFSDSGIIFLMNANNRLQEWAVFANY